MSSRWTKGVPEFVYFVDQGEWTMGPFVRPRPGNANRKFKLVEVENSPKTKVKPRNINNTEVPK